jgi:hypothetical protein
MAITFSTKAKNISNSVQTFNSKTADFTAQLKERKITTSEAEKSHQKIIQVFQQSMQEISNLKIDIAKPPNNVEDMMPLILEVTVHENDFLEGLKGLNDTLLTYYPTAKIFYGDIACIGPKKAPKIDTSNPKILEMLSKASAIREIRGDGNCFISAFTTAVFEKKSMESLINFIFQDGLDAPELKNELIQTLMYLSEYPSQLENVLQDNQKILPFISYFRQLAAREMKDHKDDFKPYFFADIEQEQAYGESTDGQIYEQLVDKYVLTMGVDFSHPMIIALCRKLDFPVRIIDPKIGAPEGINVLDRPESYGTFCRKDQHYFVLYTPEHSSSVSTSTFSPQQASVATCITVKHPYNGNKLFIRGDGPGMGWEKEKGIELHYAGNDTWTFKIAASFEKFEYKILLNNEQWETTNNHKLEYGKKEEITPQF